MKNVKYAPRQPAAQATTVQQFLHVGYPTQYFSDNAEDVRKRWEERLEAWKDAVDSVRAYSADSRVWLFEMALEAPEHTSSWLLDKAEEMLLGTKVTDGTWPKRQRFWKFVGYVAAGHTPRDLAMAYEAKV